MVTVKQRFRKSRSNFKINTYLFIILLLAAIVGGFLLSDSNITDYSVFEKTANYSECGELMELTQEFIDESNYWRNDAQICTKNLWACGLQLKQCAAR